MAKCLRSVASRATRAENCRAYNIGGPKVLVKAYVPATVAFPLLALGTSVVNSRCETWKLSPRHIFQILFKHTSAPNFPQSSLKIVKTPIVTYVDTTFPLHISKVDS